LYTNKFKEIDKVNVNFGFVSVVGYKNGDDICFRCNIINHKVEVIKYPDSVYKNYFPEYMNPMYHGYKLFAVKNSGKFWKKCSLD